MARARSFSSSPKLPQKTPAKITQKKPAPKNIKQNAPKNSPKKIKQNSPAADALFLDKGLQQAAKKLILSKRIVVKVGTNALMRGGKPNVRLIASLAGQIASLSKAGKEVILVSSGAIGFGAMQLGETPPVRGLALRQACAAAGQPHLMAAYQKALKIHGISCAQLLLTRANFTNAKTLSAVTDCLGALIAKKALPIINENDSVATEEIETRIFGDNDQLGAIVASHFGARALVLLTDIDALYDKDPKRHADARAVPLVRDIRRYVGDAGDTASAVGTGGMRTKILAAQRAREAGCITVIADARRPAVLEDMFLRGKPFGTVIVG